MLVYSTDCSKAVVPVLVLFFFALRFILRGDLFTSYLMLLCSCVFVLSALQLPRLGKIKQLIFVLFVRYFDLRFFGFVCFVFLLVSGKAAASDCGTPWTFLLPFLLLMKSLNKTVASIFYL